MRGGGVKIPDGVFFWKSNTICWSIQPENYAASQAAGDVPAA